MVKLSAETLLRVEEIFHAIVDLQAGSEQDDEALRLSLGDHDLAEQALLLAAAHRKREDYRQAADQRHQSDEKCGVYFGRYRTVKRIGSGGMGTVFLAERADGEYRQTVAIKVIHSHLAADSFHRRFLEERQILAALQHSAITKILDGGVTESGLPFLVMEYIPGQALDVYCRQRQLDARARLTLFQQVCEPVAYAHRNLVVHRDLKPSNIVVTAEGNPVLLDFGTAKFLEGINVAESTAFPLLTLRYSSPEQRRGEPVSTAVDIYSLGIILYELLTGEWPFGNAESVAHLLKSLGGSPVMDPPRLPSDLSSILSKALAPDPALRYESVPAFSADIRNWLNGMPVLAKPARPLYRAKKFVGRHLVALSLTAFAAVGLLIAASIAFYEFRLAQKRYLDLRSLTAGLLFELKDAINDMPGSTAAQQILVNRVLKNLAALNNASSDPDLQLQLGEAYRQLGELQGDPYSQNLSDAKGALQTLEKGRAIAEAGLLRRPSDPQWLHLAAFTKATEAEVCFQYCGAAESLAHIEKSVRLYERLIPLTKDATWITHAAVASQVYGDLLGQPGTASASDPLRAASYYRRAIDLDQLAMKTSQDPLRQKRGIAVMRVKLGDLLRPADPAGALQEFLQASRTFDAMPPEYRNRPVNQRIVAWLDRKVGNVYRDLRRWPESEAALQRARKYFEDRLAADSRDWRNTYDVALPANDLTTLFLWRGDFSGMLEPALRAASCLEELQKKEPLSPLYRWGLADSQSWLAVAQFHAGREQIAARLASNALSVLNELAMAPGAAPHISEVAAEDMLSVEPARLRNPERAVFLARKFLAATGPDNITALSLLARALDAAGQLPEARITAQKAIALYAPVKDNQIPYMRTKLEQITHRGN